MAIHRNPIPVERLFVKAKPGVMVPDQRGGYFSSETATSTPHDRYARRRIAEGSLIVCDAPPAPPPPAPPAPVLGKPRTRSRRSRA